MDRHAQAPGRRIRLWSAVALGILGLAAVLRVGVLSASPDAGAAAYYSTAAPPVDYRGAEPSAPVDLASIDVVPRPAGREAVKPDTTESAGGPARLASAPRDVVPKLAVPRPAAPPDRTKAEDPVTEAKRLIAECKARYGRLNDYSCTFFKRERMADGRMTGQHVMQMKSRTRPFSIYFKFLKPNAGREVIFVHGRNGNRAMAHDVGLGKLLAGTLNLDPRSRMAMEENRHPITDAGIGHLIDEVSARWAAEMKHGETAVTIQRNAMVGDRRCTMIESKHPAYHPSYLFHKVKVYIDHEHKLPIRFEAYDWPRRAGAQAELVEEYTYVNLKLDGGLGERDFDPGNPSYSFGRF
jgi:hypothetical protein